MQDHSKEHRLLAVLILYVCLVLGACLWPLNFFQENRVAREEGSGLRFASPGMAYTQDGATGLAGLSEFTLLLHFRPDVPGETAWILSYGLDFNRANFLVGLNANHLVVEMQRGSRMIRTSLKDVLDRGKPVWLALAADSAGVDVYINGDRKKRIRSAIPSGLSWQANYPIVVGSRSDGKFPWDGVLYQIAILGSAATEGEVRDPVDLLSRSNPLLHFDFTKAESSQVVNSGKADVGPLIVPKRFVPLRRAVLMDLEELWFPLPLWGDIVVNVLAFVPIGLLIALILEKKLRVGTVVALAVVASCGLSLGIELLQSYLPRRWSTFMDVAANTAGGILGVMIWLSGLGERVLSRLRLSVVAGVPDPPARE